MLLRLGRLRDAACVPSFARKASLPLQVLALTLSAARALAVQLPAPNQRPLNAFPSPRPPVTPSEWLLCVSSSDLSGR